MKSPAEQMLAIWAEDDRLAKMPQNTYTITIDGEDYTKHIPMPIKWSALLDERLDEGRISLKRTKTELFQPMTEVVIRFTDKKGVVTEKTFIVSLDEATETPVGSGYYNHEISLIEETKKLEGIIIEPITYTNDLGRDYSKGIIRAQPHIILESVVEYEKYINTPTSYTYPLLKGSFTFQPFNVVCPIPFYKDFDKNDYYMHIYEGAEPIYNKEYIDVSIKDPQETFTLDLKANKTYTVYYGLNQTEIEPSPPYPDSTMIFSYSFYVVTNYAPLEKWSITQVIDRLLDLAIPHLENEQPRYKLNDVQKAAFAKIEAPEFAFSKCTLKEALDQIGGFIHGVPRLKGNTIYFDMLGGTTPAALADPKYPYISNMLQQSIESYATKLDSTVDNLVNILDAQEGVITEPYANGYKTVRSEEAYAQITDGNMVIATQYPIYSVEKLEVGPLLDGGSGGDITAYVFEAADYGLMSSFEGGYPNSKAFAIYYTQGQKNIKGLNFKSPKVFGSATAKYSIVNIIEQALGQTAPSGTGYPSLSFRITYTPIFGARVEQHKTYYKGMYPRTLAYNQSANLVETRYYGENMKGLIARTGNAEIIRMYRLDNMSLVPHIGETWDEDYYVSSVTVAVYPFYIDCEIGLSKDFNRLSQYIGINSQLRMYEISEKQAYNRDMVYADYCVIGDAEASDDGLLFQNVAELGYTFMQIPLVSERSGIITGANISTYDEEGGDLYSVTLPVISTAMGNTLVFSFAMQDNYSAGDKSVIATSDVDGCWQTSVPYNDYYGRFATMAFSMRKTGHRPTVWSDMVVFDLPQGTHMTGNTTIGMKDGERLVVRKDNREIFHLHYQLHYVTNRKSIIIGPAMTHNCTLVRGMQYGHGAKLYVLPKRLSKFAGNIDLDGATFVFDYTFTAGGASGITTSGSSLTLKPQTATANGAAWAIVDGKTGELLIGENVEIVSGQPIDLPTLTLKHNIY